MTKTKKEVQKRQAMQGRYKERELHAIELWIQAHTPYRFGWWKNTFLEWWFLRGKVLRVFCIMLSIPTSLFVGIEWWYGPEVGDTSMLKDAQKGVGG